MVKTAKEYICFLENMAKKKYLDGYIVMKSDQRGTKKVPTCWTGLILGNVKSQSQEKSLVFCVLGLETSARN